MAKYLPFIVTCIVIAPMVAYQWVKMSWVWGASIPAQQCAYVIMHPETGVPMTLGEDDQWEGEDVPVDPRILKTAGADGYIQRTYTNVVTGKQVQVWFIVGSFKEVSRHTPNYCYKTQGFSQVEYDSRNQLIPGYEDSKFYFGKFFKEENGIEMYQRVYWAWWKPEPIKEGQSPDEVKIQWRSPENPRLAFGICPALYKLYFTANTTAEESFEQSVCLEFAEVFLPEVHKIMQRSLTTLENDELPEDWDDVVKIKKAGDEPAQDAKQDDPVEPTEDAA